MLTTIGFYMIFPFIMDTVVNSGFGTQKDKNFIQQSIISWTRRSIPSRMLHISGEISIRGPYKRSSIR